MKVKCIVNAPNFWTYGKKRNWLGKKKDKPANGPKYGDVVTVDNEYWCEGKKYYRLLEWPNGKGYQADGFVPLSEQFEKVSYEKIKESNPIAVN